jgi:hypothetical protein
MAPSVRKYSTNLTPRQNEGRAANAIAELLARTLSVPNIYLEPHSGSTRTDVLAVDRAGSGDLHGVEVKLGEHLSGVRLRNPSSTADLNRVKENWLKVFRADIASIRKQLMSLPVHYKYVAVPESVLDMVLGEIGPYLYSPDGLGRIGIISLLEQGDEPLKARIVVTPERFRVDAAALAKIEKELIANRRVRPDIEVRI